MAEPRRLDIRSDAALEAALRSLAGDLAMPRRRSDDEAADPARLARLRIEAGDPLARPPAGRLERLGRGTLPSGFRPARRGLVLAVVALLVLAAIAGAIGFGLPGLRIVFGPVPSPAASTAPSGTSASPSPTASPTPPRTPGPPGSTLGLGVQRTLEAAAAQVGFPLRLPSDPRLGAPDAVWLDSVDRVTLVWTPRPGYAATGDTGLGLIVTEFPGTLDEGYFEKLLNAGSTIETVTVSDGTGYWISGRPHEFVYIGPSGEPVWDTRRLASDTLAWSVGNVTYRIESELGRDAAVTTGFVNG